MKRAFACLLWAAAASAQTPLQVDLYRLTATGGEVAVSSVLDLGVAAAGDIAEVRLRLRSREAQAVTLRELYASTLGATPVFSAENYPSLPYIIARGTNVDFRVRFAPKDPGGYQGTLNVLDKKVTLTGTAPEGATVQAQRGASFEILSSTSTIDFGAVERKQSAVRQFALVNRTSQPQTVTTLSTSGAGYLVEGMTAPITLAPGITRTFAVRFAPQQSGILRGKLVVDQRAFELEGFALEPPLPVLSFETAVGIRSGQQASVRIRLSEPSRAIGTVRLTLSGLETDTAIALLPAGGRTATLALKESDTELLAMLQTGTTAGTLKLSADVGAQHIETQLVLSPLVPALANITATRASGRVEVRTPGFDNTRSIREAGFQFYDRAGAPVGGVIRTTVADAFSRYFTASSIGGVFSLTASFPVTGDIESITAVEVELTNSQGVGRSAKIAF